MSTLKRCGGYKGHHACAEEYPDHMVPIERFGLQRSSIDDKQFKQKFENPYKKIPNDIKFYQILYFLRKYTRNMVELYLN